MIVDKAGMSVCNNVSLIEYLPMYYRKIEEMIALQKALSTEVSKIICVEYDVFLQGFVETATWGLRYFEEELGLDLEPDIGYDRRREVIKAKLRGSGTTTIELIKNVSVAYSNGEVEVVEHNDKYYIEIKFVGVHGIPANMVGLKKILAEIIPAHLGIEYVFTYMTWNEYDSYNHTWDEWDSKELSWDKLEIFKE